MTRRLRGCRSTFASRSPAQSLKADPRKLGLNAERLRQVHEEIDGYIYILFTIVVYWIIPAILAEERAVIFITEIFS